MPNPDLRQLTDQQLEALLYAAAAEELRRSQERRKARAEGQPCAES